MQNINLLLGKIIMKHINFKFVVNILISRVSSLHTYLVSQKLITIKAIDMSAVLADTIGTLVVSLFNTSPLHDIDENNNIQFISSQTIIVVNMFEIVPCWR